MDERLAADARELGSLLAEACAEATAFLDEIERRPVLPRAAPVTARALAREGVGARDALAELRLRYGPSFTGSAGPRYFGFVTGGSTPAALVGDWLTSAFDQNAHGLDTSAVADLEREAAGLLRQLLGLPGTYTGAFVTGTTMANFVGMAQARQWLGLQLGVDVAEEGSRVLPAAAVLSGTPHASLVKALALLGLGRRRM